MNDLKDLTREELLEIANLFLSEVHSDGFKVSEAKDFLFDEEYWFLRLPKPNWKENIAKYLTDKGYPLPNNKLFITKKEKV